MTTDIIQRVRFSASAAQRWQASCELISEAIHQAGIAPEDVPFEQAKLLPEGRLAIYIDPPSPLQGTRFVMLCDPEEWWFVPQGAPSAN